MAVKSEVELLRKVSLFADVDDAYLQVMAFSSKRVEIKPGQFLVRENKSSSAAFLIVQGNAEAIRQDAEEETFFANLGPGAFVCAKSMVAKLQPNMSVRAKTRLTALRITHELFLRVCKEFPETGAQILDVLSKEVGVSMNELQRVQALFDNAKSFSKLSS